MKLKERNAPHIRHSESSRIVMLDVILILLPLYLMAFYYYGARVWMLGLTGIAACVICQYICSLLFFGQLPSSRDFSPVVTGMILPLLMPASIPYSIVIAACIFAILVAKYPFGGMGQNLFNPAAAGYAFVTVCFSDQMFSYPQPLERLPVFGEITASMVNSPAFTLRVGGVPTYDFMDLALGNVPGPMGATNSLVIVACLLYLISRGRVRWQLPAAFFSVVALLAYCIPRGNMDRVTSIYMELMCGSVLFAGAFLLGDPVTIPKRDSSKAAFGVATALVVILFRRYGGYEEGIAFAILFMNGFVLLFDLVNEKIHSRIRRKRFEAINRPSAEAGQSQNL